jgi:5-methyltetrahydropteroyltriglutamate--homocysteine methyltransferase
MLLGSPRAGLEFQPGLLWGAKLPRYAPYTTTVIGAHSVPRWYEPLDRLMTAGQLAPGDFADAQQRATQAAILEQEVAGI